MHPKQKRAIKLLSLMAKLGLPSAQERLREIYILIASEKSDLGKVALENLAKAGDTDARAVLNGNIPDAGMIYLQIRAEKGNRVAQQLLGRDSNE